MTGIVPLNSTGGCILQWFVSFASEAALACRVIDNYVVSFLTAAVCGISENIATCSVTSAFIFVSACCKFHRLMSLTVNLCTPLTVKFSGAARMWCPGANVEASI